jgi:hypothetical protein
MEGQARRSVGCRTFAQPAAPDAASGWHAEESWAGRAVWGIIRLRRQQAVPALARSERRPAAPERKADAVSLVRAVEVPRRPVSLLEPIIGGQRHAHLIAEAAGQPIDPGAQTPLPWRECAARRTGLAAPEQMTDGAPATFVPFESGYDPADPVDQAIMATRTAVFPQHGLMPP